VTFRTKKWPKATPKFIKFLLDRISFCFECFHNFGYDCLLGLPLTSGFAWLSVIQPSVVKRERHAYVDQVTGKFVGIPEDWQREMSKQFGMPTRYLYLCAKESVNEI
jgi:hypothetical protein